MTNNNERWFVELVDRQTGSRIRLTVRVPHPRMDFPGMTDSIVTEMVDLLKPGFDLSDIEKEDER